MDASATIAVSVRGLGRECGVSRHAPREGQRDQGKEQEPAHRGFLNRCCNQRALAGK
jgi:hypothetical protein